MARYFLFRSTFVRSCQSFPTPQAMLGRERCPFVFKHAEQFKFAVQCRARLDFKVVSKWPKDIGRLLHLQEETCF